MHYLTEQYFWNYCVILPIISLVGIVGNVINLAVLYRGIDGPFKGFMYTYMRLLSMTDLTYLLYTIQACVFTDLGYYLSVGGRLSGDRALIAYVWVYLTPLWNTFGTASDLIVVCMTISRFVIIPDGTSSLFLNSFIVQVSDPPGH